MADQVTKSDLSKLERHLSEKVDRAVDDLTEAISQLAHNMHAELQTVKDEVTDLRASVDRIANTLDHFLKRLNDIE